ncbi:hypothetical protein D3C80_2144030 [compost metagenome]
MVVENIVLLDPQKLDIDELRGFIINNLAMLDTDNQFLLSSFRKLIRYYDWLVFS